MNFFHTDGCGKCPFLTVDNRERWCCSLGYPLHGSIRKAIVIDSTIVQDGQAFPDDCPLPVTVEKE